MTADIRTDLGFQHPYLDQPLSCMRFKTLRCLTQTPSVPAVTMQKPGEQRELTGRSPAIFFFFLRHVNLSVRGKKTDYFPWILFMHFGLSKMASLSRTV